jgi:hypothetical protein
MIPTPFFVVLITFAIMHATPGGPWDTSPDSRTSDPRIQAALNKQYGLDKPLYVNLADAQAVAAEGGNPIEIVKAFFDSQFVAFVVNLSQLKLGPSYRFRGRQVVRWEERGRQPVQAFPAYPALKKVRFPNSSCRARLATSGGCRRRHGPPCWWRAPTRSRT